MTLALTAALLFHTDVELADWQTSWNDRMVEGETPELIAEFKDMAERHPCRLVECPQPKEVATAGRTRPSATTPPPTVWPGDWAALVAAYFHPEDVQSALKVIQCESQFSLTAKNPISSAWGPWQFLRDTWDRMVAPNTGSPSYDSGAPTDPVWSTINASWLWYNVGPSQWSCW